jgi:hypothetical protein
MSAHVCSETKKKETCAKCKRTFYEYFESFERHLCDASSMIPESIKLGPVALEPQSGTPTDKADSLSIELVVLAKGPGIAKSGVKAGESVEVIGAAICPTGKVIMPDVGFHKHVKSCTPRTSCRSKLANQKCAGICRSEPECERTDHAQLSDQAQPRDQAHQPDEARQQDQAQRPDPAALPDHAEQPDQEAQPDLTAQPGHATLITSKRAIIADQSPNCSDFVESSNNEGCKATNRIGFVEGTNIGNRNGGCEAE